MSRSKPVDVGNGAICASFAPSGAWFSFGGPHATHGFVELNGLPAFDEARRGDPSATRAFRRLMADAGSAFLHIEAAPGVTIETDVSAEPEAIVQHIGIAGGQGELRLRFHGRLDRPALAEITEVDPPEPTGAVTQLSAEGSQLRIEAAALPARCELRVALDPAQDVVWTLTDAGAELAAPVSAGQRLEIRAALAGACAGASPAAEVVPLPAARDLVVPANAAADVARIVDAALRYVRACTALRTSTDERVMLTDHRLLPLSWTRDAYYQALMLLAAGAPGDVDIVADHLRWLWRACERPDGRWVRSHHANGRRKDLSFQVDQQLYPILELADFWSATGSVPRGVDWPASVAEAWLAALAEVDSATGLVATTENAADDRAAMPFILSSQILLWRAASRLSELADDGVIDAEAGALRQVAHRTRVAVDRHLLVDGAWAYATDGRGNHLRYHDANDLPTALASVWGFCTADDPAWRTTMGFAFSPANPGYCAGRFGGLGSLHTAGTWPLGDSQAWLFASLTGDRGRAGAAIARLCEVAYDDAMLPEAYDATTGQAVARDWFAWPGALLGALVLLDGRGDLSGGATPRLPRAAALRDRPPR